MNSEARKALAFLLATVAVGVTLTAWLRPLLHAAAGPESELLDQLRRAEREGFTAPVGTGELRASKAHFDRVSVAPEGELRALAHATLDFDGKLGATAVSSLGVERIAFEHRGEGWHPTAGLAPVLCAVLERLELRREALERADAAALAALSGKEAAAPALAASPEFNALRALQRRAYQVDSWHIRVEREGAQITERFRLTGSLPDRPVDRRGERSLTLNLQSGQFFFSGELM